MANNNQDPNEVVKLLFVCHGNICRSTMAESLMTELVKRNNLEDLFQIASAGTSTDEIGNDIYPATVRVLKKHGIPVVPHKAVRLTQEDYQNYHLLLGMDTANIKNMRRMFDNDPEGKIHRLLDCCPTPVDIEDPWYTGEFTQTFVDISQGCNELLISLLKERSPQEAITVTEKLPWEDLDEEEAPEGQETPPEEG